MNTPLKLTIATLVLGSFAASDLLLGEHPACRRWRRF